MQRMMLMGLLCVACAPVPRAILPDGRDMQSWTLQSVHGQRVHSGAAHGVATLTFHRDHMISGTSACNSIGPGRLRWLGTTSQSEGRFDRAGQGAGITTTARCNDRDAATAAERFWALMMTARRWLIEGRHLTIDLADGSTARLVARQD